jgi:transcriptional regulator with XRE-family HTH domain
MNTIERLCNELQKRFAEASFRITPPVRTDGQWTLDISHRSRELVVNWLPPARFGVSSVSDNTAYGEGADEIYSTIDEARERIVTLLSTEERSSPPVPALLSRIREERGLTQSELARRLHVAQATVSGIERRKDIQLSTLRRTIEALGGSLRIVARFSDASYTIVTESIEITTVDTEQIASEEPTPDRPRLSFPSLERRGELGPSQSISKRIRRGGGVLALA